MHIEEAGPRRTVQRLPARAKVWRVVTLMGLAFVVGAFIMTLSLWAIAWHDGSVDRLLRYDWSRQGSSGPWGRNHKLGDIQWHAMCNAFFGALLAAFGEAHGGGRLARCAMICGVIMLIILVVHMPLFD